MRNHGTVWRILLILVLCTLLVPKTKPKETKDLVVSSITIAPPIEYLLDDVESIDTVHWYFSDTSANELPQLLASFGMQEAEISLFVNSVKSEPTIKGLSIEPSDSVIRSLTPEVRSKLYGWLYLDPINYDELSAYYFYGSSIDSWLGDESVTPLHVRRVVDPLIYQIEDFLYLTDIGQVRKQVPDDGDFYNFLQRLIQVQSMYVTLEVTSSNINEIEKYWGVNSREAEIRPLLRAMISLNSRINIADLLPNLPRGLLYRYPNGKLIGVDEQFTNCFWSALNFFNKIPDESLANGDVAVLELQNNYYPVDGELQFGDVAVFTTGDMFVAHVAVYLVDGLYFTKNGSWKLAPWIITPLEPMRSLYLGRDTGGTVTYYRRIES